MQFGNQTLPVPDGYITTYYGSAGDPSHKALLEHLQQRLMADCNAAYETLLPSDGYVVKLSLGFDYQPWLGETSNEFPMLCLWRQEFKQGSLSLSKPAQVCTWRFVYTLGPVDKQRFVQTNGLFTSVNNSLMKTLIGSTPGWGFHALNAYKSALKTLYKPDHDVVFPVLEGSFDSVEALGPSPSDSDDGVVFDPRYMFVTPVANGVILFNNTSWTEIP